MQIFTIGLGRAWWIRLVGGNPLVRRSDRTEAWVSALAVLIIAIAAPVAGAIGTSVYDAQAHLSAEEGKSRQRVVAIALGETSVVVLPADVEFDVRATWSVAGREHDEIVVWPDEAKAGDQETIWVDDQGQQVTPPSPRSRAVGDAVGVALSLWLGAIAVGAGGVSMTRRRLDRGRYSRWEHEINALILHP